VPEGEDFTVRRDSSSKSSFPARWTDGGAAHPEIGSLTKNIPAYRCSVLSNQKKAFSLGAVEYFEKPAPERPCLKTLHRSVGLPTDA